MLFNFSKINSLERYKLMSQTLIPRPIAWIVTEDAGVINIAPFSYFTALSSKPATMIISIGHKKDGSEKDTLHNIRKNKKCTICIVPTEAINEMHKSGQELQHSESEATLFDIKTKKIFDDFPSMIENVPVAYFCTFHQEVSLEGSKTIPLIVEIQHTFIDDNVIEDSEKMYIDFKPLARVGKSYARLGEELPTQV